MNIDLDHLPTDIAFLHHMIIDLVQENDYLKHQLELLKAKRFGKSSEKLNIEKLDNQIAELERRLEEKEALRADFNQADNPTSSKNHPGRGELPEHLPREDNVIMPDPICPECGSMEFRKIADDVSEVLEYVPSSFKVIRNVRPRCACTVCEKIVQAYPPSGAIDKGKAGPGLLAHILLQKYCNHLPFYRQSQIYGYEGIELSRSTMASWSGACANLLAPLSDEIRREVFASSEIHGDDTPVRVLAPGLGKTKTGRIWVYIRDGRPHGDTKTHPAACYFYSPDRKGIRPEEHLKDFRGVLHADAYSGYNVLYAYRNEENKSTDKDIDEKCNGNSIDGKNIDGRIIEAACWAHTRRKFYEVSQTSEKASIAYDTLERIGSIYKIEEEIRGMKPDKRREVRIARSKEMVDGLFASWKRYKDQLPKKSPTAGAIRYALNNEEALKRFLDNGKIEIDNNAAERALRSVAVGRKNWLFAGSDRGGETAASMYTLIETVKLNNINPWKYLSQVLRVIQDHPANRIAELLPWNLRLE